MSPLHKVEEYLVQAHFKETASVVMSALTTPQATPQAPTLTCRCHVVLKLNSPVAHSLFPVSLRCPSCFLRFVWEFSKENCPPVLCGSHFPWGLIIVRAHNLREHAPPGHKVTVQMIWPTKEEVEKV